MPEYQQIVSADENPDYLRVIDDDALYTRIIDDNINVVSNGIMNLITLNRTVHPKPSNKVTIHLLAMTLLTKRLLTTNQGTHKLTIMVFIMNSIKSKTTSKTFYLTPVDVDGPR
jgi:hypothetical protein